MKNLKDGIIDEDTIVAMFGMTREKLNEKYNIPKDGRIEDMFGTTLNSFKNFVNTVTYSALVEKNITNPIDILQVRTKIAMDARNMMIKASGKCPEDIIGTDKEDSEKTDKWYNSLDDKTKEMISKEF